MSEWLPIERMDWDIAPEGVLLCVHPGRLFIDQPVGHVIATWDGNRAKIEDCGWVDERGEKIKELVTHWMPLPEPPIEMKS